MNNAIFAFLITFFSISFLQAQSQQESIGRDHIHPRTPKNGTSKTQEHHDYPLLCFGFDWNDSTSAWDSTARVTYTYTPQGDVSQFVQELYDGIAFANEYKGDIVYNAQSGIVSEVYQNWNGTAWENFERGEHTYDAQGTSTNDTWYRWRVGAWDSVESTRFTNTYVFTNKLASQKTEYFDTLTHQWQVQYELDEYHWSNTQGWDTCTSRFWDGFTFLSGNRHIVDAWYDFSKELYHTSIYQHRPGSVWENVERYRCNFGQYGSHDCITDHWNVSVWDSAYRYVSTMDLHDHEIRFDGYIWNASWQLSISEIYTHTYSPAGLTLDVTNQAWNGATFDNTTRQVYPTFFTASQDTETPVRSITAYPNPCTDRLNFDLKMEKPGPVQIALYDLEGRIRTQSFMHCGVNEKASMAISEQIPNGTYTYIVSTSDGKATGKLQVIR